MRFIVGLLVVVLAACGAGGDANAEPSTSSTTTVFHGPGVEDRTGSLLDWEYRGEGGGWVDLPDGFRLGVRQSSPQGIEVGWWSLPCDDDPRLVIESAVIELTIDGYLDDRPDPEVGCASVGIWREFRSTFAEPVDVESLTLEVIEPPG